MWLSHARQRLLCCQAARNFIAFGQVRSLHLAGSSINDVLRTKSDDTQADAAHANNTAFRSAARISISQSRKLTSDLRLDVRPSNDEAIAGIDDETDYEFEIPSDLDAHEREVQVQTKTGFHFQVTQYWSAKKLFSHLSAPLAQGDAEAIHCGLRAWMDSTGLPETKMLLVLQHWMEFLFNLRAADDMKRLYSMFETVLEKDLQTHTLMLRVMQAAPSEGLAWYKDKVQAQQLPIDSTVLHIFSFILRIFEIQITTRANVACPRRACGLPTDTRAITTALTPQW
eukprot:CAMPEP_0196667674 /NCGR_PEP_ID=MMETSP1086-20130531/65211_1 /TAXON_ID=77921 /ORGANISM="Cyanoptyche  gloeocystis , Strain SAG4.97" /LENGTH=283 /DNA_ID=CAMNT_0042005025 /DNA_START=47 /DNA_END=895 /DNA_ORIENTATION=-